MVDREEAGTCVVDVDILVLVRVSDNLFRQDTYTISGYINLKHICNQTSDEFVDEHPAAERNSPKYLLIDTVVQNSFISPIISCMWAKPQMLIFCRLQAKFCPNICISGSKRVGRI